MAYELKVQRAAAISIDTGDYIVWPDHAFTLADRQTINDVYTSYINTQIETMLASVIQSTAQATQKTSTVVAS